MQLDKYTMGTYILYILIITMGCWFVSYFYIQLNPATNASHYKIIKVNSLYADPLNNQYYVYSDNGSFIIIGVNDYAFLSVGYTYNISYKMYIPILSAKGLNSPIEGYTGKILNITKVNTL